MRREQYTQTARFIIWTIVSAVIALLYLDNNPIHLTEVQGKPLEATAPRVRGGDVLIVVDPAVIERAASEESFEAADFSWAWLNVVEQEIGPCTVIERRQLRATDLSPFRFVILTRSVASGDADADLISHLDAFTHAGGVLVLERPGARLRSTYAADGNAGVHAAGRVTLVEGMQEPFDAQLRSMPLMTSFVGSSQPAVGARTHLAFDGVPVVYSVPRGRGAAVTVEFDFGRQVVALQQGLPNDDFSVPDRYTFQDPPRLQSFDLVAQEALFDNPIPFADLLEKFMIHGVLSDLQPVVALWPYRGGRLGALVMTHDEPGQGVQATWMTRWESDAGYGSTVFLTVPPNLQRAELARLQGTGADVQLLWHRPQDGMGLFEEVGLWEIHPMARPIGLDQQAGRLRDLFGTRRPLRAARSQALLWGPSWDSAWVELARQEVPVDSSLGPREYGRGYLFGGGLPYRPLDRRGLPLPVTEYPIALNLNTSNVDGAFLRDLFYNSRDGYHEALTVAFDPETYHRSPSVDLFDLWLATFALAEDTQHWITHLSRFQRHWRERTDAELRVRLRIELPNTLPEPGGAEGKVKAPPELPPSEDADVAPMDLRSPEQRDEERRPPSLVMELEVKSVEDGHTVSIPWSVQGRSFVEAQRTRVGPATPAEAEPLLITPVDVIGRRHLLLPLSKGLNAFAITYR